MFFVRGRPSRWVTDPEEHSSRSWKVRVWRQRNFDLGDLEQSGDVLPHQTAQMCGQDAFDRP